EMRHPTFPAAELDKLRQQSLAGLQRELEDPDAQATRAFQRAIFPAGHPNRPPSREEDEASLKAMTRDELEAFYRQHYGPDTDRAITSLEAEVKRMREQGVTDRERLEALAFLTGYFPVRLETNAGLAGVLLVAEYYGLGMDYIQKYASYYEAVTTSQVNEAAK